ncbi:vesicular, overexpressed in cancer, prosurvival protein 1 isoform X1 [Diceros bicornis minor]|uniref:vesicular, overexpressed in cancer, prosurvival protein 1 isoform X1 n=1 Tax=Diceros bicornis minor TaxID=77932 RepID=UPI0026EB3FFD|nr:vesicular, overexpressed in cancer, prosurvival protein 1 isoform X1 [Diceros bicornis minor]
MSCLPGRVVALLLGLLVECTEAKKHCWYFEGLYPTYYICRPYEDCCGSRCCVRALSIQRLWYFWFLLMMGVLFCCGAGFFIRRRMYPPPLIEEPAFNVSYTRQPPNPVPGQPARVLVSPPCSLCVLCKHLKRALPRNMLEEKLQAIFIHLSSDDQPCCAFVLRKNSSSIGLYVCHFIFPPNYWCIFYAYYLLFVFFFKNYFMYKSPCRNSSVPAILTASGLNINYVTKW